MATFSDIYAFLQGTPEIDAHVRSTLIYSDTPIPGALFKHGFRDKKTHTWYIYC